MKSMHTILFVLLMFTCYMVNSQGPSENPGTLPSVIPPSPEVANLVKIGSTSANLHTGAASVNIPLYELKVGTLSVPIALAYSTNGTKTNDIASRVGLGWSLIAGGSISRVIHDEEDDAYETEQLITPNFGQHDQALLDYLIEANEEHKDTEADEYSFSVNGISGKFFFDQTGQIRVTDHSNIKITKNGNAFTLITGDGIKYEFDGLVREKTIDVKTNGKNRTDKDKFTVWFLTKISSPEGDYIYFHYHPITTKTHLGPNQSVILKPGGTYPQGFYPNDPSCSSLCSGQWSSVQFNKVEYNTFYLNKISTSNNQELYFSYLPRPDISGDNRLMEFRAYSTNGYPQARMLKKYRFEYEDPNISGTDYDINKRFFLKKLYTESTGLENPPITLAHQFEYNDPSTLGSQESLLQDYYGYSKGNGNQPGNFFPRPDNYSQYEDGFLGADRSPNFIYTQAGTLKKIYYPTGGSEEFFYEPHTLLTHVSDSIFQNNISVSGPGTGYNSILTYTKQFTPNSEPIRISYTTEWNPAGPEPGSPGYWTPDSIHFLSYLEIWKVSTNERVFEARHRYYDVNFIYPHLQAGVLYEIRLKVAGNSHASYVSIQYNPYVQVTPVNENACGIRVRKIQAFDPVTNTFNNKYFTYAALSTPSITSGIGQLRPNFQSGYQGGGICFVNLSGEIIAECPIGLLQVSSSTLSGFYTFSGSPVGYTHVIESDDSLFVNGAIEHQYQALNNPVPPMVIIGSEIAGASSAGAFPDYNGTETKTTWFKNNGSTKFPVKIVENVYSTDNRIGYLRENYVIRKRWNPPTESQYSYTDKIKAFDVSGYLYMSKWRHLDQTITTTYDDEGLNPIIQTVAYDYNNTIHTLPTTIATENSKQQPVIQTLKYPHDYSVAPYPSMVANNIITPVIEQKNTIATIQTNQVETQYSEIGQSTIFKPIKISIAKAGQLEERLQYHQYDASGNLLEVSKKDGIHMSYLWNYKKTFPVAEITNASFADVCYTSFEGDEDGGWAKAGTILNEGITGISSFTGTVLSKELNTSKTYVVTVWAKGSVTVNNLSTPIITTKRGWKLYKWEVTNSTSVEVNGTEMDELRLYPKEAQIITYTYLPFVGLSSASDVNNKILYYEYDGFNRLWLIRDIDNNIVKQFDYKYNQPIAPCSNTASIWMETGITQCVMTSNGNYSGEQMKEEKDMNNCSPTYLQSRWISLGVTGQCEPVPNCSAPNQRVVAGDCAYGEKVLISSLWTGSTWKCTYKYVWADGYESHSFIEYNASGCMVPIQW